MKGLELSRAFYTECGLPMLEAQFPALLPRLAVGLCGSGSECFGFDDEISRDHDFEPGFCVWLPDEKTIDRRDAFQLERAYAKLPKEFMGFRRSLLSPVGGNRHGVLRLGEFLESKIGNPSGDLSVSEWFSLPSYALAEVVNGEIFRDDSGVFTKIRKSLMRYPEDVRRKKLAGYLLLMAQSGQYNYLRCLRHGESAAAQLAVGEFVKATMNVLFLLDGVYMPYYKWSFRALRALPRGAAFADLLETLLTTPNDKPRSEEKYDAIEGIASAVIELLQNENLTRAICGDLEKHAYSVNDAISDAGIRNLHIFYGVPN